MYLEEEFWRDFDWWRGRLRGPCCRPLRPGLTATLRGAGGTDASTTFGAGAEITLPSGATESAMVEWDAYERTLPINVLELLGVLLVLTNWGSRLKHTRLDLRVDNRSVFWCLYKGRAKSPRMAELMRRIHAILDHYDIVLDVRWVSTHDMGAPDDYSRGVRPPPPTRSAPSKCGPAASSRRLDMLRTPLVRAGAVCRVERE